LPVVDACGIGQVWKASRKKGFLSDPDESVRPTGHPFLRWCLSNVHSLIVEKWRAAACVAPEALADPAP
jgi:hypothetical protein